MSGVRQERNDGELIKVIAPMMFTFADKTFKFVSWLIIIAAIRIAGQATGSAELTWLYAFLLGVYTLALLFTCFELMLKGFPASAQVPKVARWTIAAALFFLGISLQMLLILPQGNGRPMLDNIIDQLTSVRD